MLEKESSEKTVKIEKIAKIRCDGNECKHIEYGDRRGIWNDYDNDCENTTVRASLILGGKHIKYDFDVCPTCFAQKIVPLFDGKGVKNRLELIRDKIISKDKDVDEKLKIIDKKLTKCTTMIENAELLQKKNRLIGESSAYHKLNMMISNLA
jgi:hypothetical protein